ncbi:hypothetical protein D9M72_628650 [compost metagenome]
MRIEPVTQAVTEKIKPKHGKEDGEAGKNCSPWRADNELTRIGEHITPAWFRRTDTEAKIRKCGFCQNSVTHAKRTNNEDWPNHIRYNLCDHDTNITVAKHLGGLNIALLFERKR